MMWITEIWLWVAFLSTIFLMVSHWLSPWFAHHLPGDGRAFTSFAGGVAVAYVFLHTLPDLVEYNKPIGDFLLQNQLLTQFSELMIYIVALAGFLVYYGLELAGEHQAYKNRDDQNLYILHIFMFCLYNFLITYTMSLRAADSILATILFTFAMALHFVLIDRKFSRLYTKRFNQLGRFILMLALFIGWAVSVIFDPVDVLVAAFMLAFLAGSVLVNVFREEFPKSGLVSYIWFVIGTLIIMLILIFQVIVQKLPS